MTLGVSLTTTGVSLGTTSVSLMSTTLCLPATYVSLLQIGVLLIGAAAAPPPSTDPVFNFSLATSSMYLPLFGGFA